MSNHLPSPAPSPFPGGPGANPPRDSAAVRTELEAQLKRLIQDLWEVEICAGEVGPGLEDAVPGHLAKVNAALVELTKLAPQVTDSVPRTVVEYVDKYKNPHQYTKTTLSRATGENQYALGRALGLESFRRQLEEQIGDAFPDLPLPERRHQPVGVEVEGEGEGEGVIEEERAGVGESEVQPAPAGYDNATGDGEEAPEPAGSATEGGEELASGTVEVDPSAEAGDGIQADTSVPAPAEALELVGGEQENSMDVDQV